MIGVSNIWTCLMQQKQWSIIQAWIFNGGKGYGIQCLVHGYKHIFPKLMCILWSIFGINIFYPVRDIHPCSHRLQTQVQASSQLPQTLQHPGMRGIFCIFANYMAKRRHGSSFTCTHNQTYQSTYEYKNKSICDDKNAYRKKENHHKSLT